MKNRNTTVWISIATSACAAFVTSSVQATEMLTFNSMQPGTIVSSAQANSGLGPILVSGLNPNFAPSTNAAVLFDSSNPTGGDFDLGTTNEDFGGPGIGAGGNMGSPFVNGRRWGNLLIVGENLTDANNDGLVDDPSDFEGTGGVLTLDFSQLGAIRAIEMGVIDTEGIGGTIKLYGPADVLLATIPLPNTGNNGIKTVNLGWTHNVQKIVTNLGGSGGIDQLCFDVEELEGCTLGYWKNHPLSWVGTGYTPMDNFDTVFGVNAFSPDITLIQALNLGGGGLNKLARQGVAALLNASSPGVDYPLTQAQVLMLVHDAIISGNYEPLATQLDDINNSHCPLN